MFFFVFFYFIIINNILLPRSFFFFFLLISDLAEQYGIKIQILGDTKLLKQDVLESIDRVTKLTENNNK